MDATNLVVHVYGSSTDVTGIVKMYVTLLFDFVWFSTYLESTGCGRYDPLHSYHSITGAQLPRKDTVHHICSSLGVERFWILYPHKGLDSRDETY